MCLACVLLLQVCLWSQFRHRYESWRLLMFHLDNACKADSHLKLRCGTKKARIVSHHTFGPWGAHIKPSWALPGSLHPYVDTYCSTGLIPTTSIGLDNTLRPWPMSTRSTERGIFLERYSYLQTGNDLSFVPIWLQLHYKLYYYYWRWPMHIKST